MARARLPQLAIRYFFLLFDLNAWLLSNYSQLARYGEMFVTMERLEMVSQMIQQPSIKLFLTVDVVAPTVDRVLSILQQSGSQLVPTWLARQSFSTITPSFWETWVDPNQLFNLNLPKLNILQASQRSHYSGCFQFRWPGCHYLRCLRERRRRMVYQPEQFLAQCEKFQNRHSTNRSLSIYLCHSLAGWSRHLFGEHWVLHGIQLRYSIKYTTRNIHGKRIWRLFGRPNICWRQFWVIAFRFIFF